MGSNSAHLDVVDVEAGAPPLPIYALKASTKLGGNIGASGVINNAGAARVVNAVSRTLDTAREMNVAQLYPFATAAIRDAANRDQILDAVEHETGLRLQLLTGEQEGRLTYLAVRHGWAGKPAACSTSISAAAQWNWHSAATPSPISSSRCHWARDG
nr:hypothetical protein [Mycolicibacterium cosmeticum]